MAPGVQSQPPPPPPLSLSLSLSLSPLGILTLATIENNICLDDLASTNPVVSTKNIAFSLLVILHSISFASKQRLLQAFERMLTIEAHKEQEKKTRPVKRHFNNRWRRLVRTPVKILLVHYFVRHDDIFIGVSPSLKRSVDSSHPIIVYCH